MRDLTARRTTWLDVAGRQLLRRLSAEPDYVASDGDCHWHWPATRPMPLDPAKEPVAPFGRQ